MELTGKQQAKFRNAIISAFPSFTKLKIMFSDELNENLEKYSNTGSYEDVVFNLIEDFNSNGQIEKLINAALKNNPGNAALKKFYLFFKSEILEEEIDSLQQILKNIDFDLIKLAYEKSLPKGATIDCKELNNPTSIDDIFRILLEDYPKINDIPSLIEFAEQVDSKLKIKVNSSKSLEEELNLWIESLRQRLDIQEKNSFEIESDFDTNQHFYLFIVVDQNLQQSQKLHLKAEFLIQGNKEAQSEPLNLEEILEDLDEEKGILYNSLEEIINYLKKNIQYFLSRIPDSVTPNKTINIFLPYEYLSQNIDDKLRIRNDLGERVTIIEELNMIVHPLERFRGTILFNHLKDGWKRLIDTIKDAPHHDEFLKRIEVIEQTDNFNGKKLSYDLKKQIGLKLTSPLQENIQKDFLKAILSGGIPFAFWTRCET